MKEITLKYPVTVDNQEYTTLTMRRPRVRDQLAVEKIKGSEGHREVRLLANLADVSPQVLEELDMMDYGALQEAYRDFLTPSQETSAE